ncbi:MAG: xanthine dehydrogenase, molybdenum binding subunit apoprotein, partial [Nocardioides sp.]|nr:xanthine dehydrogenase, molybdenum binding subunit apoprotein [Nocardioides sp.]
MTELLPEPVPARAMGAARPRVDGPAKVTGLATYAVEHPADDPLHLWLVQSTIARGRVVGLDTAAALAHPGVVSVLDHTNAPRLVTDDPEATDPELVVLQDDRVAFRGQIVAAVLAETSEAAREGAALVSAHYDAEPHRVEMRDDSPAYAPDSVNPDHPTDSDDGDVEAGLAEAEVVVDQTYRTAYEHNNP